MEGMLWVDRKSGVNMLRIALNWKLADGSLRYIVPKQRCILRWLPTLGWLDIRCLSEDARKNGHSVSGLGNGSKRNEICARRLTEVHDVVSADGTLERWWRSIMHTSEPD